MREYLIYFEEVADVFNTGEYLIEADDKDEAIKEFYGLFSREEFKITDVFLRLKVEDEYVTDTLLLEEDGKRFLKRREDENLDEIPNLILDINHRKLLSFYVDDSNYPENRRYMKDFTLKDILDYLKTEFNWNENSDY